MDKLDILFVGPWKRVVDKNEFISVIKQIRLKKYIGKIIYSSSDKLGIVPAEYFDNNCTSSIESGDEVEYINSNSTYDSVFNEKSPYIINSKNGIDLCNSKYVLRVRSDLKLSDIDLIYELIVRNEKKLIIDFDYSNTILVPFYFSDMLLAGKLDEIKNLYSTERKRLEPGEKKYSISPFKYLSAGKWDENYIYAENLLWNFYNINRNIYKTTPNSELGIKDFMESIKIYKQKFILVNRAYIFEYNKRLNNSGLNEKIIILDAKMLIKLFVKSTIIYMIKSTKIIVKKFNKK